jgi:hypothetical protein
MSILRDLVFLDLPHGEVTMISLKLTAFLQEFWKKVPQRGCDDTNANGNQVAVL